MATGLRALPDLPDSERKVGWLPLKLQPRRGALYRDKEKMALVEAWEMWQAPRLSIRCIEMVMVEVQ